MRGEVFRRVGCPQTRPHIALTCPYVSSKGMTHDIRRKAWPYLLGVLMWDASTHEREMHWEEKRSKYHEVYDEWCGVEDVFNRDDIVEVRDGTRFSCQ